MATNPKKNLVDGKYTIRDLVDLKKLHGIFQHFTDTMGFTIGFLSVPDMEVLIATGWRDICTKFHRVCPIAAENCRRSNVHLTKQMTKPGKVVIEACANGLVDCAMPIFIKGKCVAILATGQVLLQAPNLSRFRRQAKVFGCHEKKYMAALAEVPVISEKRLKQVTGFLKELALLVAELGYASLKEKEKSEQLARDVEERMRTEIVLKEMTGQLQTLQDAVTDGVIVAEVSSRKILKVNRSACQMFGYSEEEFLGRKVTDLHPGAHRGIILSRFLKLAKGKGCLLPGLHCLKKDGEVFYADLTSKPLILLGKRCLVGFFRDTTERILAEERERETSRRLQAVFDSAFQFIALLKVDGKVLEVNNSALKFSGLTLKNVRGRFFGDCLWWMASRETQKNLRKAVARAARGQFVRYPVDVLGKNREVLTIDFSLKPVRNEKGRVVLLTAEGRDITEIKRVEEELKKSLSLEQATLESTADGILVVDSKGKLADSNERFAQLWNIPSKILRSRDDGKLLKHVLPQLKDPGCFLSKVAELYRHPKKDSFDVLEFQDGRIFERYSHPQLLDGKPVGRVWSFRDVTGRKKNEHDLLASETRYRRLFEAAKDGILILNAETGLIEDVNPFLIRMLGYSHKAFLGKKLWEVGAFKDTKKCKAAFLELQRKKYIRYEDMPLETREGRIIQAEFISNVYRIDGFHVIQCNIRDVTDRKRAEEALLVSRQRMALHVQQTPLGVIEWDVDFKTREWNPAAEKIFGFTRKEVLGRYWDFIVPDSAKGQVAKVGKALISQKGGQRSTNENITKEGKIITCEWFNTTLVDPSGKTIGVASLVEDITERKQAQEALRESRRQLLQVIDTVPHMIFAKDKEGRFLLVNRAVGMMYGEEPSRIVGKRRQDIHPVPEEAEKFMEVDCQVLATGKPVLVSNEVFTDVQARKHILQTIKIPFRMAGMQEECILGVSVDVTEQKKVEEFRNDIIRTVSHELRTPLSIEKEGISLLIDEMVGPVNAEQKEILGTVMRNIDRLARMITSLLDISSIETGKIRLLQKMTNLSDLVKDVAFEFKKRAGEKNIDLVVNLPELSTQVFVDPDKITQVLSNLVDNAIKFTQEKGNVVISLAVLKEAVECEVRDNGIGIAPENVKKLFEKFQQFSRTAGPGEKGFGLGLSIAKGIVDLHGGRIWIESELGTGTRATFSLPFFQKKEG